MLATSPNPIFAANPADAQGQLRDRHALRRPSAKRIMQAKLQARNAVSEIGELPAAEETLHCVCRGNFPLWSIVPATLKLASPAKIDALKIATLSYSTTNATDLLAMLDGGQVGSVTMIVSVYFSKQNPREYALLADGLAERGHRIVAVRSHAKIITIALSDGRRLVVESSANLRSCRNIEQFALTDSPALHDFHAGWIQEVVSVAK